MEIGIQPFWLNRPLTSFSEAEWELLCDRCGRCCLKKLENATDGRIYLTNVSCRLLDIDRCECTSYQRRREVVPECIALKPPRILRYRWLPRTCAYRLLAEGKPLCNWHPLVSGSRKTVHRSGVSVRGKVISEVYIHPDQLFEHIVEWPL